VSEASVRQLRILHIVSSGGVPSGLQQSLFMPLLTRMPKQRVKTQIVCLSPGAVPAAVLRQQGIPVHDVALSRRRFSLRGLSELTKAAKTFEPDIIQAWGATAQIVSIAVRKRCGGKPRVVWCVAGTAPLPSDAGTIERQKLKWAARLAPRADRIVYSSQAGASQHRRAGFPEGGHEVVPPGVDATRFKPDPGARRKVREQLHLAEDAFVIGMVAPFQSEYDHATLIKAASELIRTQPQLALVLAGHGVQKGNAPLMALIGSGALSTRAQLLGEWSDIASLFSACDVVCSSALTDSSRMTLATAMLCGIPCVATGMGAQGEVVGQSGIAVEPGSPSAFIKGITRVMQMPAEKRAAMAQGARKHALQNFVHVRSLQKYLQLYHELVGREALAVEAIPMPKLDTSVPVAAATRESAPAKGKEKSSAPVLADLSDPDSLEAKVVERAPEPLPKWRLELERERAKRDAELTPTTRSEGDVLEIFESRVSSQEPAMKSPLAERARGVAEEVGDLLSPEMLASPVSAPRDAAEVKAPKPAASPEPAAAPKSPASAAAASATALSVEDLGFQLELLPDEVPAQQKLAV
jgi:glycosyltransferase involved in cell wall biosynthesis